MSSAPKQESAVHPERQTTPDGEYPLRTVKCTIKFGGLVAVNELDMSVCQGEIYGLIGPNGAGKTTIFNLLTGVYEPTAGEIFFQGQRIDGLKSYEISRRGVSRTEKTVQRSPCFSVRLTKPSAALDASSIEYNMLDDASMMSAMEIGWSNALPKSTILASVPLSRTRKSDRSTSS